MLKNKLGCLLYLLSTTTFALKFQIPANLESALSIQVFKPQNNQIIYQYNPDLKLLIASNMKLITSLVSIQALGESFTYQTNLKFRGKIYPHKLVGDLYLIGSGDPSLSETDLKNVFQILPSYHINEITGNLIIDESIFNQNISSSELHPEPYADYTVDPAGLIINENLTNLKFTIHQNKVFLSDFNESPIPGITNNLTLSLDKIPCYNLRSKLKLQFIHQDIVKLSGTIPKSCNNQRLSLNLFSNSEYNRLKIKTILSQLKLTLAGKIIFKKAPKNLKSLYVHHSIPLSNLLIQMNKNSNNLYAKALFMSLGAYKTNNYLTYQNSLTYYQNVLNTYLPLESISLENGSGLSRHERFSAHDLIIILQTLYQSKAFKPILNSLPQPGESGTLEAEHLEFKGMLAAKTGSLSDAKALSGYFYAHNQWYLFSIILNATLNSSNLDFYNQITTQIFNALKE